MGALSDLDLQLREINQVLQEQPIDSVGRTLRDAFAALDDLMVLANREDTKASVLAEQVMIGQLLTRCQTLASSVEIQTGREPGKLKVVRNAKSA
jgi:flagellar hook-associated protein FlgK